MDKLQLKNEKARIQKLHEYGILDTPSEDVFDDIVELASLICGTPIALIALVDSEREWLKAKKGLSADEYPRTNGFCSCTILDAKVMTVADAENDARVSNGPLVRSEPHVRFYAGAPFYASTGEVLGAIGVLDQVSRELSRNQIEALRILARQVETALEFRLKSIGWTHARDESHRVEQSLRLSLDMQAAFLSSANVGIIATDEQGIIIFFNQAAQRMLGYSEAEVVGKQTPGLFHDKDEIAARASELSKELGRAVTPGFEAFVAKASGGMADENEWTYIRKDGSRFPVALSVTSLRGAEGGVAGFLGIAVDISARKEAEIRMRDSIRFTRAVLDALSKQFCVLDEKGNILEVNKPWLDYEQEQGSVPQKMEAGANYLELLDAGSVKDRGGKDFAEGIRAVLDGRKASFSLEYSHHTGAAAQWFSGKVIPFPDQALGRVIVVHENISEHKLLEHRYRQAVESAPNALVLVNESGIIVMVNAQTEASFGYPRAELIGQPVECLVPDRFRQDHAGYRQAYLALPVSRPMGAGRELYAVRRDGTEFPVEIGLSLIENHEEKLVLATVVDITERKRLERRFRQAVELAPNAIVMVNEAGTIVMVNLQAEISFGYSRHELVGRPVEVLLPERFRAGHIGYRHVYFDAPSSRPMGVGRELFALRKDGSEFPVEIGLGVIEDELGVLILSSIVDITERKRASDKLKDALKEKEVLLKEVYHRVKNNLQVVSSLINLQARHVTNDLTVGLLRQSADRIKAMALLHEKLYQSKDLARIDFNAYIHSLVDHLLFGYNLNPDKIIINMRIDRVFLDVDTAIPCGLIINELLSNALKHAFPDERNGEICITFTRDEGGYILKIADNGAGFSKESGFEKSASLGLQLVETLTNQLMGSLMLDQAEGTAFTIRFTDIT